MTTKYSEFFFDEFFERARASVERENEREFSWTH